MAMTIRSFVYKLKLPSGSFFFIGPAAGNCAGTGEIACIDKRIRRY